MAEREQNYFDS